jgi:hypothetical protein
MNLTEFKQEVTSQRRRPKGYTESRPNPTGLTIPTTITGEWKKTPTCGIIPNERD